MRRGAVVIVFARVPQFGAGKTRLARDVGRLAAWRFQRRSLARTLRRLGRDRRWRTVAALTPGRLAARARLGAPPALRLDQGCGGLGPRMARALARFRPAPVLLVGSDIPGLGPEEIVRAFRALASSDVVFGPAADGGYWLVGVRGRRRAERWFRGVRWSSPRALADTLARVGGQARVAFADRLADVDTGADLARRSGL